MNLGTIEQKQWNRLLIVTIVLGVLSFMVLRSYIMGLLIGFLLGYLTMVEVKWK